MTAVRRRFTKRTYASMGEFWGDLRFLLAHRKDVKRLVEHEALNGAFRERLMLAVTQVNRCRYCSFAHTHQALKEGLAQDEIDALLDGELDGVPEDERTALLYAQHWAETRGQPDPEATARLDAAYGPEKAAQIHLALRVIRTGNYTGNTFDYFLYRASCGRWGAGATPQGDVR